MRACGPPGFLAASLGLCAGLAVAGAWAASAVHTSAAQQQARFEAEAGATAQPERGRQLFMARHGGKWSCASCHGSPPTGPAQHAGTGKAIEPLAPAFNAQRFTDSAKVDKWFRRNCNDVLSRECSAAEKADLVAYLLSLKP